VFRPLFFFALNDPQAQGKGTGAKRPHPRKLHLPWIVGACPPGKPRGRGARRFFSTTAPKTLKNEKKADPTIEPPGAACGSDGGGGPPGPDPQGTPPPPRPAPPRKVQTAGWQLGKKKPRNPGLEGCPEGVVFTLGAPAPNGPVFLPPGGKGGPPLGPPTGLTEKDKFCFFLRFLWFERFFLPAQGQKPNSAIPVHSLL